MGLNPLSFLSLFPLFQKYTLEVNDAAYCIKIYLAAAESCKTCIQRASGRKKQLIYGCNFLPKTFAVYFQSIKFRIHLSL